jgi:glutathione synthase/RimK-type ligase-like ATP-grasp enzyme
VITRLAWATTTEAHGLDDDEPIALPALARAGITVDLVDWDDPDVAWDSYDRVVLRSTWDYPERLAEFVAWLRRVGQLTDLRNPLPMVRWSIDKHYLADLDKAAVPVVPTTFAEPGTRPSLPDEPFVVKPAVGAGSRDAASYQPNQHELAIAHIDRLHALGASVLIQPLLASVAVDGEWPLIFFDGQYSHAASKRVALPAAASVEGLFAEETNTAHTADADQIAVAQAAVDVVVQRFGVPSYARVDLVRDDTGRFVVLEVELVEPSLFLPQAGPEAIERFVDALTSARREPR